MSSSRQDHPLPPGRVQEVADGVYAYMQPDGSWWINNTGFLVGSRRVISVDSCSTERRTRAYREAIRSVTDRPVTTLINTHHHGDHTFGNYLLPRGDDRRPRADPRGDPRRGDPDYLAMAWTEVDWGDLEAARRSSPTPTG